MRERQTAGGMAAELAAKWVGKTGVWRAEKLAASSVVSKAGKKAEM